MSYKVAKLTPKMQEEIKKLMNESTINEHPSEYNKKIIDKKHGFYLYDTASGNYPRWEYHSDKYPNIKFTFVKDYYGQYVDINLVSRIKNKEVALVTKMSQKIDITKIVEEFFKDVTDNDIKKYEKFVK